MPRHLAFARAARDQPDEAIGPTIAVLWTELGFAAASVGVLSIAMFFGAELGLAATVAMGFASAAVLTYAWRRMWQTLHRLDDQLAAAGAGAALVRTQAATGD